MLKDKAMGHQNQVLEFINVQPYSTCVNITEKFDEVNRDEVTQPTTWQQV